MLPEEYEELFDSKVTFHDRNRFEVKLDVNLPPGRKSSRYAVEVFFFIPKSLGIGPQTYPKAAFYRDIQNYIRFKTPHTALSRLIDPSNELSPLFRFRQGVDRVLGGEPAEGRLVRLMHETKMLGCMVRSTVRDHVRHFLDQIRSCSRDPAAHHHRTAEVLETGLNMVKELRALLREIRAVKLRLDSPVLPAKARDGYEFMDEFASLMTESYLTIFLEGIREAAAEVRRELSPLDRAIQETLKSEIAYRREAGFRSVVTPGAENEDLVRRRSILKKFISSVLYLKMEISEESTWREFFLGLAAGLAMLFWVVLTLTIQKQVQANTLAVGAAFVIGYVFKDRIKARLQTFFSHNMSRWLPDHQVSIVDPSTGKSIGRFREAFTYLDPAAIPAEVLKLRNIDNLTAVDEEGKPERVLKYEKDVTLFSQKIFEEHARLRSINDILRFSVADFLDKMDDPKEEITFFNPESGEVEPGRVSRVYPVEVIFRYRIFDENGREEIQLERVRLVINRKGIKRLEVVTPDKIPV